MRCPPPGYGGEHGAVAPGVLHVQLEGPGRPGEVRRRLAPLGGGAVSRGEDAAHTAAARRATGSASAPPLATVAKPFPKTAPKPPPKQSPPDQYGSYTNIWYVLQHFGGQLATEQRGSKEINVCP